MQANPDEQSRRVMQEVTRSRSTVFLHAPQYVLGEIEADFSTIENLQARAEESRMVPNPALWGWGSVFRTRRGLEAMAIDSGSATLRRAGIAPSTVEALVLCCTRVPGPARGHGRFVETILTGIGLGDIPFYGLNLNRCTNVLAALDVASAFVTSGRYRRVLVITTDRVVDEVDRMLPYALLSDGAASCVLTGDGAAHDAYQLIACATAQEARSLDWSNEISADLARRVNDSLLGPVELRLADVSGLMHANIFKPLVVMKELQAGFTPRQIYTDNIARVGHCFGADPLINLVDRTAIGHVQPNCYYMLASSVPGMRMGVLLRKLSG
jgi:3-oxoacyl-[acyl-carrier-protein] synthase III